MGIKLTLLLDISEDSKSLAVHSILWEALGMYINVEFLFLVRNLFHYLQIFHLISRLKIDLLLKY